MKMTRAFSSKLQVKVDEKGRPLAFSFGAKGSPVSYGDPPWREATRLGERYPVNYKVVNILNWWREPGRWWEGEPVTLYLRLQVSSLLRRPAVVGGGPMFCEESACGGRRGNPRQQSTVIFELCRVGEEWYFHRMLG